MDIRMDIVRQSKSRVKRTCSSNLFVSLIFIGFFGVGRLMATSQFSIYLTPTIEKQIIENSFWTTPLLAADVFQFSFLRETY